MKIVLLGNCQLKFIGQLMMLMCQQKLLDAEILWRKPIHELTNEDYLPLFECLDTADIIYGNYLDMYHGVYATRNLARYFHIKIVPTLESYVSTPQLGWWSAETPLPYNLGYIDFRILEMYLQKTDVERAGQIYDDVTIKEDVINALINKSMHTYNDRFEKKQVCFNYATYYREAMREDIESFFTMNHPSNRHLEWLLNNILIDSGFSQKISLDNPMRQLLKNYWPPSLRNNTRKGQYLFDSRVMELRRAIKIYYAYFDTLEAKYLESELHKSIYHAICGCV